MNPLGFTLALFCWVLMLLAIPLFIGAAIRSDSNLVAACMTAAIYHTMGPVITCGRMLYDDLQKTTIQL